ncbi:hypothetical protein [Aureisphaera galaxeae]|uniref:hypothetical protein n=1 Tax=Aureisphaera galaxeae TaxID=1538023 RepID=UPI0023509663|nr:hypothetical protein [Aureisphaera galaxeae]
MKNEAKLTDDKNLLGNWYSVKNNHYFEYFFENSKMYVFSTSSLDLFEYDYYIKNDSIFNSILLPSGKNGEYKFHSIIIDNDGSRLKLSTRTLERMVDSTETIDKFLNEKIDYDDLKKRVLSRERKFSNLIKKE